MIPTSGGGHEPTDHLDMFFARRIGFKAIKIWTFGQQTSGVNKAGFDLINTYCRACRDFDRIWRSTCCFMQQTRDLNPWLNPGFYRIHCGKHAASNNWFSPCLLLGFWFWYGSIPINTIFRGTNIHLPAILMWTTGVLLVLTHCHFGILALQKNDPWIISEISLGCSGLPCLITFLGSGQLLFFFLGTKKMDSPNTKRLSGWWWLEHLDYFSIQLGISSSQLANSLHHFSEG